MYVSCLQVESWLAIPELSVVNLVIQQNTTGILGEQMVTAPLFTILGVALHDRDHQLETGYNVLYLQHW